MFGNRSEKLNKILARIVGTAERFAPWVVIFSISITIGLLYYTAKNLSINSDTEDMLSKSLHFRRIYQEYNEAFPQFDRTIIIVIDANTPDRVYNATSTLANRLKRETDLFKTVYVPGSGKFFKEHALLYLSTDDLENLADNLAKFQPFLANLNRDQSLRGLFSILRRAFEAIMDGENIDLSVLCAGVEKAITATMDKGAFELSWVDLMRGQASTLKDRRRFIIVQPKLDYTTLLPGKAAIQTIRRLAKNLIIDHDPTVKVRLTGDIALEYEELLSVTRCTGIAGFLAFVFVGIVLFAGLGSPKLVAATLATLGMGLVWTGGFATVALGHLNLISVAFAVLYIGLSVDYAIHFCLRYKELVELGNSHSTALHQTAQDIGSSLVLCAATTSAGFYAFIPTSFVGVAELGLISGTSMFIALIANLTLLPAILSLMPLTSNTSPGKRFSGRRWNFIIALPGRHFAAIRIITLIVCAASLFLLPQIVFDPNPLNLRDPTSESVSTFKELLSGKKTSPWQLNVLAPGEKNARNYAQHLDHLAPVEAAITISDFVPTEQNEKLTIIDEIALMLGSDLMEDNHQAPPKISDQLTAFHRFLATLRSYVLKNSNLTAVSPALRLLNQAKRFNVVLQNQNEASRKQMLQSLQRRLMATLPEQLRMLRKSLSATEITIKTLPKDLVERWVTVDGRYRVEIMPRENMNDIQAMRRFVDAVQNVTPDATGYPVIILEAGNAVVEAFQQAFMLALVVIAILLFILMGGILDPLMILMSLLLTGVLTGASMVLFGIPFNFANVIALPLIMGIGVDSSIHIVHRIRTAPPTGSHLLQTSTARAIFLSTLTTLASFGSLAFSSHRGMASMGKLLSIGVIIAIICALVALPAFIIRQAANTQPG